MSAVRANAIFVVLLCVAAPMSTVALNWCCIACILRCKSAAVSVHIRGDTRVGWRALSSGAATPPSTDDVRILDAKRHLGCVFHLRTPGVSTMIGFSKKIQSSLDGAPRLLIARDISDTAVVFRRTSVPR